MNDDEFDAWLDEGDYATIAIVDREGETLFKLVKSTPRGEWFVMGRPPSMRSQRFLDHPFVPYDSDLAQPRRRLITLADGRQRLDVPGPPIPWEKLPPVLDRLAELGFTVLTGDELRACVT